MIEVEVVHPVEKGVKGVQLEREALRLGGAWPTPGLRLADAWPTPGRRLGAAWGLLNKRLKGASGEPFVRGCLAPPQSRQLCPKAKPPFIPADLAVAVALALAPTLTLALTLTLTQP